jgi:glucuronoarabinoxylan endo-1,4-beta-xylanase
VIEPQGKPRRRKVSFLPGLLGALGALWALFVAPAAHAEALTIEAARTRQSISGFGASSAWTAPNLSDELADALFSPEVGIGLSLLRLRIAPNGTSGELSTARKALARGARVWASPWSPPGEWKDNGDTENGGRLLARHYGDWAERLASFAVSAQEQGVPLLLLSAQNEPNWRASWETCLWEPTELTRFVRDHLGPALAASGTDTGLVAPETQDWETLAYFADPLLGDGAASGFIDVVATHAYGELTAAPYWAAADAGKELWVTELDDGDPTFDPGIGSALRVAKKLHDALTVGSVNAWHYWWLMPRTDLPLSGNGALTDGVSLARRAYAIGNFSRFVRPGDQRVDVKGTPPFDVLVTAFRNADGTRLAVVAINASAAEVTQRFTIADAALDEVVPFVTSADQALGEGAALPVVDGAFDAVLPRESITTFVAGAVPLSEPQPAEPPRPPPLVLSNESGCACRAASGRPSGAAWGALGLWVGVSLAKRRATHRARRARRRARAVPAT